ncbi:glycoprotein 96-92 [Trypanosoma conorhini]|uniref:Glycoprotein 96-92 n=1 Tax=Trypanosoma conorhini TaxID=83891 RepID=A0A3R7MMD7_9TRYP|nr:glycoprotein 96-92 [Trypanosoma conorhini]RNF17568.1 glycoprotein 96-92 [Trypanosoma conorhini]
MRPSPRSSHAGSSPDRREYQIISAQLENILSEACGEPPSGADRALIEKRITELQGALEEAGRRIREKQCLAERTRERRFADLQQRRAKIYEERTEEIMKEFERRRKIVADQMEEKRFYYNQRNEVVGGRIKSYRNSFLTAQAALVEKAEAAREKRDKMLARLKEERARSIEERKEKARLRMERCREVANRRKQNEEAVRREKRLAFMRHGEEIARRQMEGDGVRQGRNRTRCPSQRPPRKRSETGDSANGATAQTTRYKPHEMLMRELKEKEEQHRARYEAEQASRLYEIQLRAHARQKLIEKQWENYSAQLERRVQRNDEIIKMAQEKKRRGEQAQMNREARDQEAGEAVTRDVEEHRKRAEDLELQRRQDALTKNYYKWNDRADRVILQLQEAIRADNEMQSAKDRKGVILPQLSSLRSL